MRKLLGHLALAGAVVICLTAGAAAQNLQPFATSVPLGTSSVAIISQNQARKQIAFINPNDTAKVAVCPAQQRGGAVITAVINGGGCITILPYDRVVLNSGAPPGSPQSVQGTAWVGIASAGGSALTILEWE